MKTLKNHQANVLDVKARAKEFGHKFKLSTLAGAMTLLIAQSSTSYASDIEIYTKPNSNAGSGVVVMMLDTSGSMSVTAAGASACDLPKGLTDYRTMYRNTENTSGGYTREYCYFNSNSSIEAYYYKKTGSQWYKCPIGTVSVSDSCFVKIDGLPDITGFTGGWLGGSQYYYKTLTRNNKFYDRMSRLKDALYTLVTMPVYDKDTGEGIKSDVKIGIGTFPYVSNDENNLRGYMRIPAAEWGDIGSAQRTKVLDLIKSSNFKGTGGTPTSAAYAEAAAYLFGTTTGSGTYSGIGKSHPDTVVGSKYKTPLSSATAECSGQGIYFLTDGQPQTNKSSPTSDLMRRALKLDSYSTNSGIPNNGLYDNSNFKSDWSAIGAFSKSLNDLSVVRSASGISKLSQPVLTAVVGFGSGITGDDADNAQAWGGSSYGKGGYIAASESQQVVDSLNEFIGNVSGTIGGISTGSSTIPTDALNPESLQAFSYFPQFEPKVDDGDDQQLWFGNLKKYYVVNNGVYASKAGTESSLVVKKSVLQDLKDMWGDNINYPTNTPTFAKWGALSKLPLGTQQDGNSYTGRKLLTDYEFNEAASGTEKVAQNLQLVRITHQYTTDEKTKTDNPERIKGLMGLLGYNIASASVNLEGAPANLRQMGSILHSLPVLLTQSGKAVAAKDESGNVYVDTTDRQDYVLFGTTQGLLHVVDAITGVEKFSFLPKEMAEKQYELFKSGAGAWNKGKNALYYGVDGEWAAHTVYVSKDDGTLTVDGAVRNVAGGLESEKENLQGKQWVYGGLRMGGRSYYALDLTGLDDSSSSSPKIKFHIDPASSSVKRLGYDDDGNPVVITKEYAALAKMGQSWSKPKLDYVNWNGERKLVMFVGGGYDAGGDDGDGLYDANGVRTGYAGYEKYNHEQDNEIGAGVYMFDADNGELLWYASKTEADGDVEHTQHDALKYSVVSEIKTVDRNNDGIVDHVYFGDLAGQAFRVDLNQPQSDGSFVFSPQITRILDLHKTNGTSPRFYYPPVFTAHHSAGGTEGGNIVVASFISGNKSSPLLATADSPAATGTTSSEGLEFDGVYALYEYDIHPKGIYYPASSRADKTIAAAGEEISLDKLMPLSVLVNSKKNATTTLGATISPTSGWGGWYYKFEHKFESTTGAAKTEGAGVIKGLTPLIAMEGNLYVTMFDAAEAGTTSTCGAGVKGQSFTQRLCLPTGVCPELANYKYNLGSGIVSLNVGPMSEPAGGKGIVIPDPNSTNVTCVGDDCLAPGKRFIPAGGPLNFIPHRWYERYSTKE